MRSDVKRLAKCGKESAYFCRMRSDSTCGKIHPLCRYKPHTIANRQDKNEIHPVSAKLSRLFIEALASGLPNTAWCIDLAMTAIGWELQREDYQSKPISENMRDCRVMNKIRQKIERDKGVRII